MKETFDNETLDINKSCEGNVKQQDISKNCLRFDYENVKEKNQICYYVMKLAEYGDLYSFIEHSDRFEQNSARYILE